jgi:hypothetical protein
MRGSYDIPSTTRSICEPYRSQIAASSFANEIFVARNKLAPSFERLASIASSTSTGAVTRP